MISGGQLPTTPRTAYLFKARFRLWVFPFVDVVFNTPNVVISSWKMTSACSIIHSSFPTLSHYREFLPLITITGYERTSPTGNEQNRALLMIYFLSVSSLRTKSHKLFPTFLFLSLTSASRKFITLNTSASGLLSSDGVCLCSGSAFNSEIELLYNENLLKVQLPTECNPIQSGSRSSYNLVTQSERHSSDSVHFFYHRHYYTRQTTLPTSPKRFT